MKQAGWWYRRRRRILCLYWLAQVVVAYFLSLLIIGATMPGSGPPGLLVWLLPLIGAAVVLVLQGLFLLPIRRPAVGGGWPIWISLGIGALLVGVLAAAFVLAAVHAAATFDLLDFGDFEPWILAAVLGGVWVVTTPLLIAFCRKGRREDVLRRVASSIFLGTILEAAAIIPLDALVRRREDCICATGTFLALAVCGSVGLFVFGPAVLLPLVQRHRKRWYGRRCDACGYDMTGLGHAPRCPECGAGWRAT